VIPGETGPRLGAGSAWSVFFGVAAMLIGVLVLAARVVAALDGGHGPPAAVQAGLASPSPGTAAAAQVEEAAARSDATRAASPAAQPTSAPTLSEPVFEAPAATAAAAPAPPEPAIQAAAAPTETPPPPPSTPTPYPAPLTPPPAVTAKSFAIIERSCGALVYGRNADQPLPPASLTKVVTAMVAADHIRDLDARVDVDVSAKYLVKTTDSSVMGIEPGMNFSLRDLMYGLLLPSGNDAALQLAEYVAGGVPGFVAMMNDKAQALGMTGTHFVNPHGLDAAGHFSTALDLAKAARAFLAYPLLAQISATPTYETPGAVRIVMTNGNKMLGLYPGTFGVKIGYTTNARQTIVVAAERGGRQLILSLLGSSDRYGESIALLDWAFARTAPAC
jgi:D-alanyl-D-alanine carboxypeptidase